MSKLSNFIKAFIFALQCRKCPLYVEWRKMFDGETEKNCEDNKKNKE